MTAGDESYLDVKAVSSLITTKISYTLLMHLSDTTEFYDKEIHLRLKTIGNLITTSLRKTSSLFSM